MKSQASDQWCRVNGMELDEMSSYPVHSPIYSLVYGSVYSPAFTLTPKFPRLNWTGMEFIFPIIAIECTTLVTVPLTVHVSKSLELW